VIVRALGRPDGVDETTNTDYQSDAPEAAQQEVTQVATG